MNAAEIMHRPCLHESKREGLSVGQIVAVKEIRHSSRRTTGDGVLIGAILPPCYGRAYSNRKI